MLRMATPKPGEIRCPTCHRSTPPASFCTQCGSAIPSDARIRPRGMDRDELQDRIRARRSGGEPFRRGSEEGGGYERYEPDPIDARARRARGGAQTRHDFLGDRADEGEGVTAAGHGAGDVTRDLTRDRDDWARPAVAAMPSVPPAEPYAPPPSDVPVQEPTVVEPSDADRFAGARVEEPVYEDNFDEAAYDDSEYPYPYEDWEERRERRSGTGALAILGFLGLGVLALLGGALLAGLFDGGPSTGLADASPTPSATAVATVAATPSMTPAPSGSGDASGSPAASGEPVVFPDGFTAEAQPCLPGSAGNDGCDSNAATNAGAVDIWVGFQNGTSEDVVGATLIAPDGTEVDGSIDLANIGCTRSCNGYTWFPFSGLSEGTYEVRVTRNGQLAAITTFEVS